MSGVNNPLFHAHLLLWQWGEETLAQQVDKLASTTSVSKTDKVLDEALTDSLPQVVIPAKEE
jgi:hypothetical protein